MLVSLQFQDRVNQLLNLVNQDVARLCEHIADSERQQAAGECIDPLEARHWLETFSHTYTMPEQHAVHQGVRHVAAPANNDITFF